MKPFAENIFEESDFSGTDTIIAAVSGGSDSLSLLFLLKEALAKRADPPQLVAVTVDHRLRPQAREEAQWVAALCAKLGIKHKIVSWVDAKPLTALSRQARIARYNLLLSEARRLGAKVIMTGHTLNDQAETYYMRLQRGSVRGLSCMPREALMGSLGCDSMDEKIRLIRPLLSLRRKVLRDFLQHYDQSWIDDPSNECDHYERVRMRKKLSDNDIMIAQNAVLQAAQSRRQQSARIAALIGTVAPRLDAECLQFPLSKVQDYSDFAFMLGVFAAVLGGAEFLPNDSHIQHLENFITRPIATVTRLTLAGAVIERGLKKWQIWRENRNLQNSDIAPKAGGIWDQRFYFSNKSDRPIHIAPASLFDLQKYVRDHNLSRDQLHFPSLQSGFSIRQGQKLYLPQLNHKALKTTDIRFCRIMRPFVWLVSGDDVLMVKALEQIFTQKN